MSTTSHLNLIEAAIAAFPSRFGLLDCPGSIFQFSADKSYVQADEVVLYAQIRSQSGAWLDYAKGSTDDFRRQIVRL